MELIKYVHRQDSGFKLNAGNSGETGLNLSNEIFNLIDKGKMSLGEERDVTFRLYKEDCIKAICFIILKLPLYQSSSNYSNKVDDSMSVFKMLIDKVNGLFGNSDSIDYTVNLYYRLDGRIYLNRLKVKGFSVRDVLVENNSAILFKEENDGSIAMRILSNVQEGENAGEDYEEIAPLNEPNQVIYFGAPGTGKSHTVQGYTNGLPEGNVFRTTFHPDSDYSTFVGSYKPSMRPAATKQTILDYDSLVDKFKDYLSADSNITRACTKFGFDYHDSIVKMQENNAHTIPVLVADAYKSGTTYDTQVRSGMSVYETSYKETGADDKIIYSFIPQAFTKAYIRAWQTDQPVFLVIEEINRGNCAQIFGDLFQLLDRKNNISEYPIKPDTDLGSYIHSEFKKNGCAAPEDSAIYKGEELCLPANLYIWATMNTSDQSLFPIDSAFKRRWEWRYIKIAKPTDKETGKPFEWHIEGGTDWWLFLKQINRIINKMTNSADKQLGYFFAKADAAGEIKYDRFVAKVCFYLWNDIFKTYAMDDVETDLFKFTYDEDGQTKTDKLNFTEFFDENGKVVPDIVKQFIENVMKWNDHTKQE